MRFFVVNDKKGKNTSEILVDKTKSVGALG